VCMCLAIARRFPKGVSGGRSGAALVPVAGFPSDCVLAGVRIAVGGFLVLRGGGGGDAIPYILSAASAAAAAAFAAAA